MVRIGLDVSFGKFGMKEEDIKTVADYVYKYLYCDYKNYPKCPDYGDIVDLVGRCMQHSAEKIPKGVTNRDFT